MEPTLTKERQLTVTAIITAQARTSMYVSPGLDDLQDLFGKKLLLELVSSELDPRTKKASQKIKGFAHMTLEEGTYEAKISVPTSFAPVGAVLLENGHHTEMFIKDIKLITGGDESTIVTFDVGSWVHSKLDNPEPRVFFTNRSYLPCHTPLGIEKLRKKELETLCGDGHGERKFHHRVYDYDTYNDLGDPEKNIDHKRPVFGSGEHPYPRRCRTGRAMTLFDPKTEKRSSPVYVPRDEQFSDVKGRNFNTTTMQACLQAILPALAPLLNNSKCFSHFTDIDALYKDGMQLPIDGGDSFNKIFNNIPRLGRMIKDTTEHVLHFEAPQMHERDKFSWFRDEEFARQTLAGLNPMCIRLLTEFPIVSKLDPAVYGPPESTLTKELLQKRMKGRMTVDAALEDKRLFLLDYHDVYLPYVHKVRKLPDTTLYGSRTVFFLTDEGHTDAAGHRVDTAAVADQATVEARLHARVQVLTIIMWVTSGYHAAVNFGLYQYAGYFPNRPSVLRTNIPVEENQEDEMEKFMARPDVVLLQCLPSQMQAIKTMATLYIFSSHSPDEEYMGEYAEPAWLAEPVIKAAFDKFRGRLKEVERTIDERNINPENKNRCGAGIVPYELLKPFSEPGVTGRGIPNSISI